MVELEFSGGFFTWSNGVGDKHTRSKLDRTFGNDGWISRWPEMRSILLHGNNNGHAALYLELVASD